MYIYNKNINLSDKNFQWYVDGNIKNNLFVYSEQGCVFHIVDNNSDKKMYYQMGSIYQNYTNEKISQQADLSAGEYELNIKLNFLNNDNLQVYLWFFIYNDTKNLINTTCQQLYSGNNIVNIKAPLHTKSFRIFLGFNGSGVIRCEKCILRTQIKNEDDLYPYFQMMQKVNLELIRKCLKDGDSKIVLFGDDTEACKEIVSIINNKNVIFADTLRPIENISNAQSFYYDLTLMSMATKLYGTNSALVRFARLLNANLIFYNNYSSAVFSQKEQYEQISRNLPILSNLNEAQLAFLSYHHYLAGNNISEYRLANGGGD